MCTGLYTDSCYMFDVSGGPYHVALRFFRDLQKTWEIVHSAAFVVAARGELPPILNTYDVLSAHPIVRCLVEDTGGWPIATLHLGVNIIADYKKRKADETSIVLGWGFTQTSVQFRGKMENEEVTTIHACIQTRLRGVLVALDTPFLDSSAWPSNRVFT